MVAGDDLRDQRAQASPIVRGQLAGQCLQSRADALVGPVRQSRTRLGQLDSACAPVVGIARTADQASALGSIDEFGQAGFPRVKRPSELGHAGGAGPAQQQQ